MALKDIFARQRARTPRKPASDWSTGMTPRDWADLPVYHPRREDEAL